MHRLAMDFGYFTLGDLIDYLEAQDPDSQCKITLTNPHSWRGVYADLAFEAIAMPSTASQMLAVVKPCLGKTFEGYKGGDFTMTNYTDVHLANEGHGGGQRIGKLLMNLLFDDPIVD